MPMRVGTLISIQGMESLLSNHEAIDNPDRAGLTISVWYHLY